jgi:hypothetical protein
MPKTVDGFTARRSIPKPVPNESVTSARKLVTDEVLFGREPLKPGYRTRPVPAARSIDGMVIRPPRRMPVPAKVEEAWDARPRVGFDTPEFINDPTIKGKPHTKASKFRKLLALLQYPLIAILAVVSVYSTEVGQWIILAYAIYAIIRRVDSRATFVAALVLLIAVPLFQVLNQPGVAENIAVYTYELLVVGTVQSIIELIVTRKQKPGVVQ